MKVLLSINAASLREKRQGYGQPAPSYGQPAPSYGNAGPVGPPPQGPGFQTSPLPAAAAGLLTPGMGGPGLGFGFAPLIGLGGMGMGGLGGFGLGGLGLGLGGMPLGGMGIFPGILPGLGAGLIG